MKRTSKLQYLFGNGEWAYEEGYLSFVTPRNFGELIVQKTAEKYPNLGQSVVWDMFAGIGTDGSRFAQRAGKVICTELNPITYNHMLANRETFGWQNIECLCADSVDVLFNNPPRCDIVYFDPPWGDTFRSGQPFFFEDVKLSGGFDIMTIAQRVYKTYGNMIAKVPYTCDSFESAFPPEAIESIYTCSQQRLKFLFINRPTSLLDQ